MASSARRDPRRRRRAFPIFVTAFITDSVAEQRSQFILVNSTKPLPKGLIHELLPSTGGVPARDSAASGDSRRTLLERLNYDEDSPLHGRIRTPTISPRASSRTTRS